MVLVNVLLSLAPFAILTAAPTSVDQLLPGALLGGAGFTHLTTMGTGLVQIQPRRRAHQGRGVVRAGGRLWPYSGRSEG